MQSEDHRKTALQYPIVHWTLCRCQQYGAFSMKALARYQIILLGEQRHIYVSEQVSPDLNTVDYRICGVLLVERVYPKSDKN